MWLCSIFLLVEYIGRGFPVLKYYHLCVVPLLIILCDIMMHFIILFLGHVRVLYAGLLGNVVRFIYISLLKSPWWVLPFELVQGMGDGYNVYILYVNRFQGIILNFKAISPLHLGKVFYSLD